MTYTRSGAMYHTERSQTCVILIFIMIIAASFATVLGVWAVLFPPVPPDSNLYRMTVNIETSEDSPFYRNFEADALLFNTTDDRLDFFKIIGYINATTSKGTGTIFWTISEMNGLMLQITSTDIDLDWTMTLEATDFMELSEDSQDMYFASFTNADLTINILLGPRR